MGLKEIQSFNAADYLNMIEAVSKNNYKKLMRYDYELDDIISELYIAVFESLKKLESKPKECHYNIDGWVMLTMLNKVKALLNKETYRIKKNLYVEIVRDEEMASFNTNVNEFAIEHTRKLLKNIEIDVLDCLINPPKTLLQNENRTYTINGLADYLGITIKKVKEILDKIRMIISDEIENDNYQYV